MIVAPSFLLFVAGAGVAGSIAGATAGNIVEKGRLKDFRKELADKWSTFQRTVKYSTEIATRKIISQEVIEKIESSSLSLSESQHKSILSELDVNLDANLQKVEGYDTYHKNQNLEKKLQLIRKYFSTVERKSNQGLNK